MLDNQNRVYSVSNLKDLHYLNSDREVKLEDTFILGFTNEQNLNLTIDDLLANNESLVYRFNLSDYDYCSNCDVLERVNDLLYTENDTRYCSNCSDDYTFYCDDCESYYDTDLMSRYYTSDNREICEYCRDNYYSYCDACDELINNDYAFWDDDNESNYCESCYNELVENRQYQINGYYFKPTPTFYKTDEDKKSDLYDYIYSGVEVEVEQNDFYRDRQTDARTIIQKLNKRIYCKSDSSLDRGFEIVSEPFTLNYGYKHIDYVIDATKYLIDNGYRSDETRTCGYHIHINRTSLGFDEDTQKENIEKIMLFFETYKNEICLLSRRCGNSYAQFLSDEIQTNDKKVKLKSLTLDYIKDNNHSGCTRYRVINLNNTNTIEFRIFKGTLNYKTIFATLEFINNLIELVRITPLEKISFSKVVNYKKTRFLKEYIKTRGIKSNYKYLHDYSNYVKQLCANEDRKKDKIFNLITKIGLDVESVLIELAKSEDYIKNMLHNDGYNFMGCIVNYYKELINEYELYKGRDYATLKNKIKFYLDALNQYVDMINDKKYITKNTYDNYKNTYTKLNKEVM